VATLAFLFILFVGLIVLPLLFLKVLFALLFLPFKILGGILRLGFGLLGGLFKLGFGLLGLVFGLLVAAFFLVLLPLLPFLVLGGFVWLVARALRPRPALRVIA
jgi:hypothetical protein